MEKPKSIQTTGLLVTIFSAFILLSNGMSLIVPSRVETTENPTIEDPLTFFMTYQFEVASTMVAIGICYLLGGIFIRKHKLWANRMVSILSIFMILFIWVTMIALAVNAGKHDGLEFFSIGALIGAGIWSTPIGVLIWFLNRKEIKKHFE